MFTLGILSFVYAPVALAAVEMEQTQWIQYGAKTSEPPMIHITIARTSDPISRAAFVADVVDTIYTQRQIDGCFLSIAPSPSSNFSLLYTDVQTSHAYAKEICIAMRDGMIRGFSDGSFRPDQQITFAEAAKIVSKAYVLAPFADAEHVGSWFTPYVKALSDRGAIPVTITSFNHILTYGEAIEMVQRVSEGITWHPSRSLQEIEKASIRFMPTVSQKKLPAAAPKKTSSLSSEKSQSSTSSSDAPWYKIY